MKISVAMATYNGRPFIRDQIMSIDNQNMPDGCDLEIVVADDGSSDGTIEAIREMRLSKAKLVLSNGPGHRGVANAFERAIRATSGDFIFLSDQDDVWLPGKVSTMIDLFDNGADLVYSDFFVVNAHLEDAKHIRLPELSDRVVYANFVPGFSIAFRSGLKHAVLPIDAYIHDWWIVVLAHLLFRTRHCREALTMYRQHGGNAIGYRRRPRNRSGTQLGATLARLEHFYRCLSDRITTLGHPVPRIVNDCCVFYQALIRAMRSRADAWRLAGVLTRNPMLVRSFLAYLKYQLKGEFNG